MLTQSLQRILLKSIQLVWFYQTSIVIMVTENFSRTPTGQIFAPVCIGDIDAYDFKVSHYDVTEDVAKYLQVHPEVPGVMLVDKSALVGVIPRHKMFERLGRRYGVELFLRKPIFMLQKDLKAETFSLPFDLRVEEAVQRALKRSPLTIYDPLVITFPDHEFRLLDMHNLLLAQSQILENLNGVMNSFNRLDEILKQRTSEDALDTVLIALRHVVPFHDANLLILGFEGFPLLKLIKGLIHFPGDLLVKNPIYKSIFEHQQAICLDDVQAAPSWQKVNGTSKARSWMGLPLVDQEGFLGILTLSRNVISPFSNNERDMSAAFAWYFSQILSEMVRPHSGDNFPLKHLNVRKELHQQPALQAIKKPSKVTI